MTTAGCHTSIFESYMFLLSVFVEFESHIMCLLCVFFNVTLYRSVTHITSILYFHISIWTNDLIKYIESLIKFVCWYVNQLMN